MTINQGLNGPYRLDFWQCNDITLENIVVADMNELVSIMNTYDPSGNWVNNASTFTISGGDDTSNTYGDILITHVPTDVQATIMTNFTGLALGTDIEFLATEVGTFTLAVESPDCCIDEITIIVEQGCENLTVEAVTTDANCCGGGNVNLITQGGTGIYTYNWANGSNNGASGFNLSLIHI